MNTFLCDTLWVELESSVRNEQLVIQAESKYSRISDNAHIEYSTFNFSLFNKQAEIWCFTDIDTVAHSDWPDDQTRDICFVEESI